MNQAHNTFKDANDSTFYVDYGANVNMNNNLGTLTLKQPHNGDDQMFLSNGNLLPISQVGTSLLHIEKNYLHLKEILVVPKLKKNLLFVNKLITEDACVF